MKITVYNPKNMENEIFDDVLVKNSKPENVSLATVVENDNFISNEENDFELDEP